MLARTFFVIVALAVAIAAGLVFLPIAILVDPVTRAAGAAVSTWGIFALVAASHSGGGPEQAAAALRALWTLVVTTCVLPVVTVGLIGELAEIASSLWYVGITGLVAAALPWLVRVHRFEPARSGALVDDVEGRLVLIFFLTGACSGFAYWLIAGRAARGVPPAS